MADFDKLIRGAIVARNATTAEQRQKIYDSSRNALQRLIDTNRSMTVESAVSEQKMLENAIADIEQEYTAPPPPPPEPEAPAEDDPFAELKQVLYEEQNGARAQQQPMATAPQAPLEAPVESPPPAASQAPMAAPEPQVVTPPIPEVPAPSPAQPVAPQITEPRIDPAPAPQINTSSQIAADGTVPAQDLEAHLAQVEQQAVRSSLSVDTPHPDGQNRQYGDDQSNMPLDFAKRRRSQRRFGYLLMFLLILGVLAWGGYLVYKGLQDGTLLNLNEKPQASDPTVQESTEVVERQITILEASDLASLIVADRGEARILADQDVQYVQLTSVRSDTDRLSPAQPILLRLQPGVLQQISGKRVTFELLAKSGTSEPAQFAVRCQFGTLGDCGRKRFRVGVQPTASVFAFDFGNVQDLNERVFIEISTDTTAAASATGRGDVIDVVYARLIPNP